MSTGTREARLQQARRAPVRHRPAGRPHRDGAAPRFDTITYRELLDRMRELTNAWPADGVRPGDRVAVLGFTGIDYTVVGLSLIQLGAVAVPLQISAAVEALRPWPKPNRRSSPPASFMSTTPQNSHSPATVRLGWRSRTTASRSTTSATRCRPRRPGSGAPVDHPELSVDEPRHGSRPAATRSAPVAPRISRPAAISRGCSRICAWYCPPNSVSCRGSGTCSSRSSSGGRPAGERRCGPPERGGWRARRTAPKVARRPVRPR